jgi:hypothetical protein
MPGQKFQITEVKIRVEASVSQYAKTTSKENLKDLKELLSGVKNMKNWVVTSDSKGNVTEAHPVVDGHPGHVQSGNWKMNVERGNNTVDRLWLKMRKYKTEPNKRKPEITNVKIAAAAFLEADTK